MKKLLAKWKKQELTFEQKNIVKTGNFVVVHYHTASNMEKSRKYWHQKWTRHSSVLLRVLLKYNKEASKIEVRKKQRGINGIAANQFDEMTK